jgi:TM2 domain-containing membrane protein YozV
MAPETVTCPACGTQAPAAARFCPNCGRTLVVAFAGQGGGAGPERGTEPARDITPTTAPMPETTPERPGLEQESERAGVTGTGGAGIPPFDIPAPDVPTEGDADELPADLREDMNAPASYTPPPAYSTAPAYASPEYSAPETPRYAAATPPAGQYTPYGQYAPPPTQGQYSQYGAPAQTRDISRVEAPNAQPPAYSQPYQQPYPQPAYPPQHGYARPKDPTVGMLLELIGLFGILGIGHIYAGKVTRGVVLMASFFMYFIVFACLSVVLIGIPFLVLYWVVPIISALYLRNEMERELRQFNQQRY